MTDSNAHAIHPDFEKLPKLTLKFSPLIVWLLNLMLKVTRFFRKVSPGVSVTERTIPGDAGHNVPVKIIRPAHLDAQAPVLIYYHGGGFALSYGGLHLDNAERYAIDAGCVVVFVCYRLAMQHPFPEGFNDCFTAVDWVADHATELGIDPARIAVGGDSAGGAMAASVAQRCRDESQVQLCGQLLIYPVTDNECKTESANDFTDVPLWNAESNRRMWAMYLKRYAGKAVPQYAAAIHDHSSDLPRSYVETAEFDPLRDEGLNYAKALSAGGVDVEVNETKGTVHGFDSVAKNPESVRALTARIEFLKTAFSE